MTVAGQSAVSYTYDNADRLTTITQGSSTVSFAYDNMDRQSSLTLPNGVVMEYAYDMASKVTGITYKLGAATLGTLSYTYDFAGNRTSTGGTWARANLPAALTSATYDAANQISTWAGTTFTYDSNGNLTGDGTKSYTWNVRNQLTAISGAITATFNYDGFGRRRARTVSGTTTQFLYDGLNPVQELSGGTPTATLLTGLDIDSYFTRTDASGERNFLTDVLGSTVGLVDSSGTVVTDYSYEPFGAATPSGASTTNAFGFTGRENDLTGLQYSRARYYDPRLQRFIAEDPLGHQGGMNLFAYAANQPTRYRDSLGLKPHDGFGGRPGSGASSSGPGGAPGLGAPPGGPGPGPGNPDTPPEPPNSRCRPPLVAGSPKGERNWEKNERKMDDALAREAVDIANEQGGQAGKEYLEEQIRSQGQNMSKKRIAKLRGLAKLLGKSAGLLAILPELIWPETVGGPEADFPPQSQGSQSSSPCQ
jgi:RHS repeat-associated protein